MDLTLALVPALLAACVIAVIALLVRGGGLHLGRIVLPLGLAALLAQLVIGHWSVASFALLGAMIVSAAALAVRGGSRDHAPTWVALAVFALAGLVGGYGVLVHGLCAAGDTYDCAGTGSNALALIGWVVALGAYGYLARQALRR